MLNAQGQRMNELRKYCHEIDPGLGNYQAVPILNMFTWCRRIFEVSELTMLEGAVHEFFEYVDKKATSLKVNVMR